MGLPDDMLGDEWLNGFAAGRYDMLREIARLGATSKGLAEFISELARKLEEQ